MISEMRKASWIAPALWRSVAAEISKTLPQGFCANAWQADSAVSEKAETHDLVAAGIMPAVDAWLTARRKDV